MWDGHLDRINIAKHHIELTWKDAEPMHSASLHDGLKDKMLLKEEIDEVLSKHMMECAQKELETSIKFSCKQNQTSRFSVSYTTWMQWKSVNFVQVSAWIRVSIVQGTQQCSSPWMSTVASCSAKSTKLIATRPLLRPIIDIIDLWVFHFEWN